jgi:NAD(P)-dependent dehydrogenase (short-subunit alcohol dehydrogenase family)
VRKPFENQTAIISGGAGDIGRAVAMEFAKLGASVAVGGRRTEAEVSELLSAIGRHNVRWHYRQVDVADAKAVEAWVSEVERQLGVPSVIVANAATVTLKGLYELTDEEWSRELRVNLDGAFYLARAATARLLHHRQPGRVVFVGSWAAHQAHLHIPAYCVAKAGMRMLCQCMALELAPHGILVNEVAPGIVMGGVSRRVWEENPAMREKALNTVPIKKLISNEEVAREIIHLCHQDNQHMTGSVLLMDGGLSLIPP